MSEMHSETPQFSAVTVNIPQGYEQHLFAEVARIWAMYNRKRTGQEKPTKYTTPNDLIKLARTLHRGARLSQSPETQVALSLKAEQCLSEASTNISKEMSVNPVSEQVKAKVMNWAKNNPPMPCQKPKPLVGATMPRTANVKGGKPLPPRAKVTELNSPVDVTAKPTRDKCEPGLYRIKLSGADKSYAVELDTQTSVLTRKQLFERAIGHVRTAFNIKGPRNYTLCSLSKYDAAKKEFKAVDGRKCVTANKSVCSAMLSYDPSGEPY